MLQIVQSQIQRVGASSVPVMATLQKGFISSGIHRASPREAGFLLRGELNLDLLRDGSRHIALQCKDVTQVALITLGPEVGVGSRVYQLGGDPHTITGSHYSAFYHGVDFQLACDLRQRLPCASVSHHGGTRDQSLNKIERFQFDSSH